MSQKFKRGDVVQIAKDLGASMSHFESDREAVIIGSYRDQYGGGPDNERSYTVMFTDTGSTCSWYYEQQLTFLRHGGESEIEGAKEAQSQRHRVESDLAWIVASWPRIHERPSGATMEALMLAIGIDNPWGRAGEGMTYYANMHGTRNVLHDALMSGDLALVQARIAAVRRMLGKPAAINAVVPVLTSSSAGPTRAWLATSRPAGRHAMKRWTIRCASMRDRPSLSPARSLRK